MRFVRQGAKRRKAPVAESLKIQKRIGWHAFLHTYSTLLGVSELSARWCKN
jgi:hypothetical protein